MELEGRVAIVTGAGCGILHALWPHLPQPFVEHVGHSA